MASDTKTHIKPLDFLELVPNKQDKDLVAHTSLLILNQPINGIDFLKRVWSNSSWRVCADGGANRLYDLFTSWETTLRGAYIPDLIHGDLDSLRREPGEYWQKNRAKVTRDDDQFSTDFGKCIKQTFLAKPDVSNIIVVGSVSGRVDQGLGTLSEMLREQREHPDVRFWLFSEDSISFILHKGTSVIHLPLEEGLITANIGILPIFGPAYISTEGLEWNVNDWETSMGGKVSTSNHIVEDEISITTDADVLFTVERRRLGN